MGPVGVLLIGFAVTDGFDMGVGILVRIIGKPYRAPGDDQPIAPHWDGNRVADHRRRRCSPPDGLRSGPLRLLRRHDHGAGRLVLPPGRFRLPLQAESSRWRNMWDWGIFIGSFVPAVVFGVAFGNLLQGVPFHMDEYMRLFYTGNFFQLLNPFGLLAGVVSLTMLVTRGRPTCKCAPPADPPAFTRCG